MLFKKKKEKQKNLEKIKKKKRKKRGKIVKFFSMIGTGKEQNYLVENFSMLISSGMTIAMALESIKKEMRTSGMKKTLDEMKDEIEDGSSIWRTMENSGIFPKSAVSLARIGEESGRLSENLKVVSLQEQKERVFKSKIRSAMMYPILVLCLTLFVGVGISWFILPRLASVFGSLKIDLPWITKILIAFGTFLGENGIIAIPAFIAFVVLILYLIFGFSKTKFIGQWLLFQFPPARKLIQETELARFGFLLGTLLDSGMPVTTAIESLKEVANFKMYSKFYAHLKESIEEGNSFQKSFASYKKLNKLIPSTVQQMIVIGEQSGHLSETLVKISEIFEEKTDTTTKNLTVILEPILLVIVWVGVVGVALAVVLPIYSLIGDLNKPKTVQSNPSSSVVETVITDGPDYDPLQETFGNNEESVSEEDDIEEKKLKILETGIGFLNVRDSGSTEGNIVTKVYPQEEYVYQTEQDGWYEIVLSDEGETGWVIGNYIEIIEEQEEISETEEEIVEEEVYLIEEDQVEEEQTEEVIQGQ